MDVAFLKKAGYVDVMLLVELIGVSALVTSSH
jgi:hypothetical protein